MQSRPISAGIANESQAQPPHHFTLSLVTTNPSGTADHGWAMRIKRLSSSSTRRWASCSALSAASAPEGSIPNSAATSSGRGGSPRSANRR